MKGRSRATGSGFVAQSCPPAALHYASCYGDLQSRSRQVLVVQVHRVYAQAYPKSALGLDGTNRLLYGFAKSMLANNVGLVCPSFLCAMERAREACRTYARMYGHFPFYFRTSAESPSIGIVIIELNASRVRFVQLE